MKFSVRFKLVDTNQTPFPCIVKALLMYVRGGGDPVAFRPSQPTRIGHHSPTTQRPSQTSNI